ncbi:MAG: hypothetical protein HN742_33270 [Lentisphaerae bacterium]|jgi:dihydrofolate synthase / folylpolyglutamate synthase|nr:hypothetical protein [Lentisphaerota bacterium]MBT5606559.1 hypothetical protein [Lentisphaerota bacterium]MBT7053468.1 hypothetical protein [Lentisphaerota bacterium]MBT7846789.1 hypothetical protein [Lentisphaerota bacterium]
MRDCMPEQEDAFFAIFRDYYNSERAPVQTHHTIPYSLERMGPLFELAGRPEQTLRVVHVAGTKGKGSTCHFVSALLNAADRRNGVFASPHLATVRERFQLDGRLIPYDVLLEHAATWEQLVRQAGLTPSLFEIMTVLALRIFAAEGCEFAVMETGIGGRLDATNYVPRPECCVITAVSFDHTDLLGDTIAEIAAEKAGIIKTGVPVVCGRQPFPEARAVIEATAKTRRTSLVESCGNDELASWPVRDLPTFLTWNFAAALAACKVVGVTPDPRRFYLPQLRARFETISQDPLVILDAAHNSDSAVILADTLRQYFPTTLFTIVLGVVQGKDARGILTALASLEMPFVLTSPRSPRPSALDELVSAAAGLGVDYSICPEIGSPADLPQDSPLLFTGSFFTAVIGETLFSSR